MKTTKKFLAIFLALTMLFTVCSLSVFASADNTWTTSDFEDSEIDYNDNDGITGEGEVRIFSDGRTMQYTITASYDERYAVGSDSLYTLYAQCAIVYTDGLSEVAYISREFMIRDPGDSHDGMIMANSNKEIAMVCCEFQIFNASGMLWEGMFDVFYTN